MANKTYRIMQYGEHPYKFAIRIIRPRRWWFDDKLWYHPSDRNGHIFIPYIFTTYRDAESKVQELMRLDHHDNIGWHDVTRQDTND
jgi:hypothetical protein